MGPTPSGGATLLQSVIELADKPIGHATALDGLVSLGLVRFGCCPSAVHDDHCFLCNVAHSLKSRAIPRCGNLRAARIKEVASQVCLSRCLPCQQWSNCNEDSHKDRSQLSVVLRVKSRKYRVEYKWSGLAQRPDLTADMPKRQQRAKSRRNAERHRPSNEMLWCYAEPPLLLS
jgi:hypothetical protein